MRFDINITSYGFMDITFKLRTMASTETSGWKNTSFAPGRSHVNLSVGCMLGKGML